MDFLKVTFQSREWMSSYTGSKSKCVRRYRISSQKVYVDNIYLLLIGWTKILEGHHKFTQF